VSLDFSLHFQEFDTELAELPGGYGPPRGRLPLARVDGVIAGCVALRPLDDDACEMKRLYLRARFHGLGLGRQRAVAIIKAGKAAEYRVMRLDTVPSMTAAIELYRSLGFQDIPPYRQNPIAGARYLQVRLR
jgi:ribosomal protein S18 acetylase RimI-like enzyme